MRTFNIIGIFFYISLALVLAVRRYRINRDFQNKKISEQQYRTLSRRNTIELIVDVVLALIFVYTPVKMFIF